MSEVYELQLFEDDITSVLQIDYIVQVTLYTIEPDRLVLYGGVTSHYPITGITIRTMLGKVLEAGCTDDCPISNEWGPYFDSNGVLGAVMALYGQAGYMEYFERLPLLNQLYDRRIGNIYIGDPIVASLGFHFGPCKVCGPGTYIEMRYDTVDYSSNYCRCVPCPADQISIKENQMQCSTCPPRQYPTSDQTECFSCPAGFYHDPDDRATCIPCSADADPVDLTKHQFDPQNVGITSQNECKCREGFSGGDCTIVACPSNLDFVSLGLLLIEASLPPEIRPDGGDRGSRDLDRVALARQIEATLRNANTEDDDSLSKDELVAALALADVVVPSTSPVASRIWAQPSSDAGLAWIPYREDQITIPEMVTHAVTSFVETGTFYWRTASATDVMRVIPTRRPAGTKLNVRITSAPASNSNGPTMSTRQPQSCTSNVPI